MAKAGDVYLRFISVGGRVAHRALEANTKLAVRRRATELSELLNNILEGLRSNQAVEEIDRAWPNLDPRVGSALLRELELIASMHEGELDDGTEDIATGKESIEDILKKWLPDWMIHLLKIFNEILKLVKPL